MKVNRIRVHTALVLALVVTFASESSVTAKHEKNWIDPPCDEPAGANGSSLVMVVDLQTRNEPENLRISTPKENSVLTVSEFPVVAGVFTLTFGTSVKDYEVLVGVFHERHHWIAGAWRFGNYDSQEKGTLSTSVSGPTYGAPLICHFTRSSHGMPAGADLPDGRYTIWATLVRKGKYHDDTVKSEMRELLIDRTSPKCGITSPIWTPIPGRGQHHTPDDPYVSTDQTLPPITGTAVDAISDIERVEVSLVRLSDRFSWDGYRWDGHHRSPLCTIPGGRSWSCTKPLPSGANLLLGQYVIYAWAYDKAGNRGVAFINVLVAPKREEQRPPRKP